MAASSSRRTTPARKKAKLDHGDVNQDTKASGPVATPSRKTPRGKQAAQSSLTAEPPGPTQDATASRAEPETPVAEAAQPALDTPSRTTKRPPRSAKSKAQAQLRDAYDDLIPEPEAVEASASGSATASESNHDNSAAATKEASTSVQTPSRARGARVAPPPTASTATGPLEVATAQASEPGLQPSSDALANISTPAESSTSAQLNAKAKGKGKARVADEDQDYEEAMHLDQPDTPSPPATATSTRIPAKTPLRTPRNAKGKAKAKLEDDGDYDDDEEGEVVQGKTADLEVYSQEGPLSSLSWIQLKTNKPRSLRPLWIQGVFQPPFFGIPTLDIESVVTNEDDDAQPKKTQSIAKAMPWPVDGHAQIRLDRNAYPLNKRSLIKFWSGQVGWVPNEGVYDWGWFPGKAFGWKQNRERSEWAQSARKQMQLGTSDVDEVMAKGNRPGWPLIQSWLDIMRQDLQILSSQEAQPFLLDTTTPQRGDLRHPTTVMKLTVPELSMRNRLKQSIASSTPKSVKTKGRAKADGSGGADADDAAEEDDDEAADDDENAIAALDANQEPINPDDPRFADIPHLGFEEKGPVCGEVLHVSVGPPDQERPVEIAKGTGRRLDSLGVVPDEGHILNAGGHVYALDWVPVPVHLNTGKEYFAVSAAASKAPVTFIGQKQERPAPASLQIWSVSPDLPALEKPGKGEARLEMVVCHDAGAAFKLAWCPLGYDFCEASAEEAGKDARLRRLGLLAGCFADGSISIFSVPHPESVSAKKDASAAGPIHVRLDPILKLEHPQQAATSLAWAGGEMLAFGGSQGWLGVWNVGRLLRQSRPYPGTLMPDYVVRAHRSSITDMSFILVPPIDADGIARTSASPTTLFTVSLDGWTAIVDLSRCASTSIERSRAVHYACAFSAFSGGTLVHEHADGSVAHYSLRPEEMLRSRQIVHTPARVLALAASAFHPMLAMASAHGELKVANTLRTLRRSQRNQLPIYQTVLDRSTGVMLLRHHLEPEVANYAENKRFHIAHWHPCLAVTAVKWNPNFGRCRLLLSGTAAGMVKVDFVKPPYESS